MKVFVPFSEELIEKLGLDPSDLEAFDLVPFDLDYECLRTQPTEIERKQGITAELRPN